MRWSGVSLTGNDHDNQDAWGVEGNTAWVLDGATRTDPELAAILHAWVTDLNRAIREQCRRAPEAPLRDLLREAIREARLPPAEYHPSATVAMGRLNNDVVEYLVLADAGALFTSSGTVELVQDNRPSAGWDELVARLEAATDPQEIAELRDRQVNYGNLRRNRPGGFWVAQSDPDAADEALTGEIPRTALVIMSDGVADEIAAGTLGTPAEALATLRADLPGAITALRAELEARGGHIDDMTAVLFEQVADPGPEQGGQGDTVLPWR